MFREMRRKNQQMCDVEVRDILAAATSGVLALAGENGYPYAVPMSFAYDEEKERLLFHTARVGHKMTAIERCDKASFCIIAEDKVVPHRFLTQYRSVIAFGRLRVLKSDEEKREAADFLGEAYYPGHPEACDEEIKKHFPDRVFQTTIPRNIRLAEAPSHGLPVGAYDRFSKGARAYKALTKEIIGRIG